MHRLSEVSLFWPWEFFSYDRGFSFLFYEEWGFRSNPFETTALGADEIGSNLMVGRDRVLARIQRRIKNGPKITTIEGQNGSGKTSAANVSIYRLYQESLKSGSGNLFLPCRTVFQIDTNKTPAEFRREILTEVAQTLIEAKGLLPSMAGRTKNEENLPIERYLNSPQLKSFQAGFAGASAGGGIANSASKGFDENGFEKNGCGLAKKDISHTGQRRSRVHY